MTDLNIKTRGQAYRKLYMKNAIIKSQGSPENETRFDSSVRRDRIGNEFSPAGGAAAGTDTASDSGGSCNAFVSFTVPGERTESPDCT